MARFIIAHLAVVASCLVLAEDLPQILTPPAWIIGTWRVEEIQGLPVVHNPTTTLFSDGVVSGSAAYSGIGARAKF